MTEMPPPMELSVAPEKRVQPHSVAAEQSVLGAIFIAPARFVEAAAELQVDDFFRPDHREIFEACLTLHRRETLIDIVTVGEQLRAVDKLRMLEGGESYLMQIMNAVPTAEGLPHYARIVRDKSILRKLLASSLEIASSSYGEHYDVQEFLAGASAKLTEIALRRGGGARFRPFSDDTAEALAEIERRSQSGGQIRGIRTGIWRLDKVLKGLQQGCVYIVAARPGVGKTALAINIAMRAASQQGVRVLFFSLEMSRLQLLDRIFAQETFIDHDHIRSGTLDTKGWRDLVAAEARIRTIGVTIDDESVTPDQIEARSNAFRAKYPDEEVLFVIDYLQLAQIDRARGESRADAVGGFSSRIKRMAKRLKAPVIEVCQINRESEKESRPPRNSDLRESGNIEQDADAIVFIYDRGIQLSEGGPLVNTEDGPVDLLITKNRAGRTGSVKSRWVGKFCSFYDAETVLDADGGFVAPAPPQADNEQEDLRWR